MDDTRKRALTSFSARSIVAVMAAGLTAAGCGPKNSEDVQVQIRGNLIVANITSSRDSVFEAASRVLVQEGIELRIYLPNEGRLETGFIDLARYPSRYNRDIWDDKQRLVKLRYQADQREDHTVLICEPFYNPYEVITQETDYTLLRPVPPGHPGFDVAAFLTRRIAALAEGRAVTSP